MSLPISLPINLPIGLIDLADLANISLKKSNPEPKPTEKPDVRRYWPVPPLIDSVYEYQNVNSDVNLRKDVTEFFHKKIIKWISEYPEFAHLKSKKKWLETNDGKMHVYHLLRHFIKKSKINWYDLRDNYSIIKEYLSEKL
jgi:hypothetical protein